MDMILPKMPQTIPAGLQPHVMYSPVFHVMTGLCKAIISWVFGSAVVLLLNQRYCQTLHYARHVLCAEA